MTDRQLLDVAEMDALFRRADFAAENPVLAERLWEKIQMKLAAERELSEDELSELAAAARQRRRPLRRFGTYCGKMILGGRKYFICLDNMRIYFGRRLTKTR